MCVWTWLTVSAFATVATDCRSAAPGVCLLLIATSRWPCSCLCDPLGFTKDWAVMLCPFGTLACQRPWQGSASNHACCPMLCGAWECLRAEHGAASSRMTKNPLYGHSASAITYGMQVASCCLHCPCSCLCDFLGFTQDWALVLCSFGAHACQLPLAGLCWQPCMSPCHNAASHDTSLPVQCHQLCWTACLVFALLLPEAGAVAWTRRPFAVQHLSTR